MFVHVYHKSVEMWLFIMLHTSIVLVLKYVDTLEITLSLFIVIHNICIYTSPCHVLIELVAFAPHFAHKMKIYGANSDLQHFKYNNNCNTSMSQ